MGDIAMHAPAAAQVEINPLLVLGHKPELPEQVFLKFSMIVYF